MTRRVKKADRNEGFFCIGCRGESRAAAHTRSADKCQTFFMFCRIFSGTEADDEARMSNDELMGENDEAGRKAENSRDKFTCR